MARQLTFGTPSLGMSLTGFEDVESVKNLPIKLIKLSTNRLDTAARYLPLNPRRSGQLLGKSKGLINNFDIDAKADRSAQAYSIFNGPRE
ncbi:hypothetical protein B0O99DRAFT_684674 [Bisporella sp. PMI_857]|nr:hypothetical protein B0O99DRAFT_684674 [Bisporella sp. PMI_857]